MKEPRPRIGTVIFEGYELLDVYGPLELFLMDERLFEHVMLAEAAGEVKSSQGPVGIAEQNIQDCERVDILLIPGGKGTRREISNQHLIAEIGRLSESAEYTCTVCTGSALFAHTGRLDGVRATTNKAAWKWATDQGKKTKWVPEARWVEDGRFFTSSGVSAGMDMALALIEKMYGRDQSLKIARLAEYDWHQDPTWDPFARIHGLV